MEHADSVRTLICGNEKWQLEGDGMIETFPEIYEYVIDRDDDEEGELVPTVAFRVPVVPNVDMDGEVTVANVDNCVHPAWVDEPIPDSHDLTFELRNEANKTLCIFQGHLYWTIESETNNYVTLNANRLTLKTTQGITIFFAVSNDRQTLQPFKIEVEALGSP